MKIKQRSDDNGGDLEEKLEVCENNRGTNRVSEVCQRRRFQLNIRACLQALWKNKTNKQIKNDFEKLQKVVQNPDFTSNGSQTVSKFVSYKIIWNVLIIK